MKKVLFLDMVYHSKTKSSLFIIELLKEHYIVDVHYYETRVAVINDMYNVLDQEYDFLVCWQVMPEDYVLAQLNYKTGVFFPMYDSTIGMTDENWIRFKDFIIISFSETLHSYLSEKGFCSKYIQYFPTTQNVQIWGEKNSLFFWQRVNQININLIMKICTNLNLRRVHVHKALDPGHCFVDADSQYSCEIEYSTWFEKKESMSNLIMQSSYYAASRIYEGIGMSFLEAMALGRCVIAPDYPTMNEYIIDGETGLLYDFEHPSLLEMPDVRKIQKNVYEYMSEGYLKWIKNKYCIIEWMEERLEQLRTVNRGIAVEGKGEKFKAYFKLLNSWLMLKNRGISIADRFRDLKVQVIMIYGGGQIANRLMEELEGTSVKVIGIIDQKPEQVKTQLPTYNLKDNLPEIDAIIVTPYYSYKKIYMQLSKKVSCKIIPINEIVGYYLETF